MAKITPIGDRIAIMPDAPEKKAGFQVDVSQMEKPLQGTVCSVGESPLITLKPEDTVLYGKNTGTEIVVKGQRYVIMRQADVLCKLEE